MADLNNPLIAALAPLTARVRKDVTAVKNAAGRQAWTNESLSIGRLAQHLNGGPARGVCPIMAGESVTMVALLDFDSHGGETSWGEMSAVAAGVLDVLALVWGCEPLAFRSSGGRGIHLFTIWDQPQDARSVRLWLADVLRSCGLRPGVGGVVKHEVEIFPKQDRVPADGWGSQFILPLAGSSELLELCDLAGALVPAGVPLTAGAWLCSPAVPVAPAAEARAASLDVLPESDWRAALDAIGNGREGSEPLSYDDWRNVVFAIHAETGGSDTGLALAHEFSARSAKYVPEFLDGRVWPYITQREGGVTGRSIMSIAARSGWRLPLPVDAFPVSEPVPVTADPEPEALAAIIAAAAAAGSEDAPTPGVTKATSECTDLANVERLHKAVAGQMFALAGAWHVWDGMRFAPNSGAALVRACGISAIIKAEAEEAHTLGEAKLAAMDMVDTPDLKALKKMAATDPTLNDALRVLERADRLDKWATASEMAPRVNAVVQLAAKQMELAAEKVDADPWAFNTASGIVDLRTGAVSPHAPGALITRLAPVEYEPDADTSAWETVLRQITCEPGDGPAPVAEFLRRWFGYALTGHVREQVLVTHFGDGSNGKSLLLELMALTSGDYATSAPQGLLTGGGTGSDDAKATALAVLRGRRMVTAHESRQGADLRDDVVKLATGDDRISARKLYGDAFEFQPTHKLQLLTNHRPVIRTQDYGIWRRIVLVPYGARFGTAAEVAAGEATAVADRMLGEKLRTPEMLRQVLAWRVRGAREWAANGLQVPDCVRLASHEYQREQDRVAGFVAECCEVLAGASEPLTMGMGGLYPAYVSWCKDGGTHALSRQKFALELRRLGHGEKVASEAGDRGRRRVTRILGLRLLIPD